MSSIGVSQVHGRRSDVAQRQGHAPGELALDIQIPLHPVTATGIEFNMGGMTSVLGRSNWKTWFGKLEGGGLLSCPD